jgi:hypothetical protein
MPNRSHPRPANEAILAKADIRRRIKLNHKIFDSSQSKLIGDRNTAGLFSIIYLYKPVDNHPEVVEVNPFK